MTFRGLFEGVELGDVISSTIGSDIDREKYICDMMNELERIGFVVEYRGDERNIDFLLKKRRLRLIV